jgi:hypothetical protein
MVMGNYNDIGTGLGGTKVIGDSNTPTSPSNGVIVGDDAPLVWEALITQTGTNPPSLTVVKNTLGVTGVGVYGSVGVYTITGFATLLTGSIKIDAFNTNGQIECSIATSSVIGIATYDASGTNQNDLLLNGSFVKITKY